MKKNLKVTNTDPAYWEKVLDYDMARGGHGDARQKAAISVYLENKEALKNDEQLEEIKDGFDLAESTIQQIEDESEAELHQTRPSNTNLRKLLTKFDYDDHFISGHAESAGVYGSRTHELPELFYNDAELKTFLKQMFPLANTVDRKCDCARCVFPNGKTGKHPRSAQGCDCKPCKQTISMAKWLVVIKLWFLEHLSDTVVETQYQWEPGACGSLVQKIRKAVIKYERDMSLKHKSLEATINDSDNSSAFIKEGEGHKEINASIPLVAVSLSS